MSWCKRIGAGWKYLRKPTMRPSTRAARVGNMANPEHLAILKSGVDAWNRWRKEIEWTERESQESQSRLITLDLRDANLQEEDLRGANFAHSTSTDSKNRNLQVTVDLRRANLSKAGLSGAQLGADLRGANLSGASLYGAHLGGDLRGTDLRDARLLGAFLLDTDCSEADLSLATLTGAIIARTNLGNADFGGTILHGTIFFEATLNEAKNLNYCVHKGPSILDRSTLIRSPGLPVRFLQGCGLSDWEIEMVGLYRQDLDISQVTDIVYRIAHLRNDRPVNYFSCFISYSHDDAAFARRLHDTLQHRGIRCWLDEKQLLPGDDIYEHVDRGIRLWDKVFGPMPCRSAREVPTRRS
jgi:uncharacterized protein YjbI with pentapeptide repeats